MFNLSSGKKKNSRANRIRKMRSKIAKIERQNAQRKEEETLRKKLANLRK